MPFDFSWLGLAACESPPAPQQCAEPQSRLPAQRAPEGPGLDGGEHTGTLGQPRASPAVSDRRSSLKPAAGVHLPAHDPDPARSALTHAGAKRPSTITITITSRSPQAASTSRATATHIAQATCAARLHLASYGSQLQI